MHVEPACPVEAISTGSSEEFHDEQLLTAMAEPDSRAIGLTVSFAPMTRVTSVSLKSSLISSISSTTVKVLVVNTRLKDMLTVVGNGSFC